MVKGKLMRFVRNQVQMKMMRGGIRGTYRSVNGQGKNATMVLVVVVPMQRMEFQMQMMTT